ncbi:hypothetical protein PVK06_016389 [Gossypium arboreum]|uniref:DUF4283 domain-containing protein n=1 Tax=Gossypium arboreum TaxID=29729 RepID=A0ABR0Q056_GOSAR|nr:hypothetical protein PVK06_016389 [Gossypium arboreum]
MNDVESLSNVRTSVGDDSFADCTTKKVRFKDGSDDSVTNMMVDLSPTNGVSWKDKLLLGATSNTFDGDANLDLEYVNGDIRRSNLNSIPAIDFSERINKILIKAIELTVVVKLLGRNIGYGALLNRITSFWKPAQPFCLMDVANGYYLVRFQCLPRFLYQKKILEEIGSLVGRVVKLDIKTNNRERGQFARMAVFVDLGKPLTSQVFINGRLHDGEGNHKDSLNNKSAPAKTGDALPTVGDPFGPWMVVERKLKRKQDKIRGQKSKITEGNLESTRFEALSSMDSESIFPNLREPSKELGTVRFSKGDFLKKLKGKETELGSGQVAADNLSEGLWGHMGHTHKDSSRAPSSFEPNLALGHSHRESGLSLECFGQQLTSGQTLISNNLGLEGAAGFVLKDLMASISFSKDLGTSLHVNPTFDNHLEAKLGPISNALDSKKHTAVIFQKKLNIISKPKAHVNLPIIPKGHVGEVGKEIVIVGNLLLNPFVDLEGNLNLPVIHESLSLKLWVLWQSLLVCKLEFLQIIQKLNLTISKLLVALKRVFWEYNRQHKLDLISLLETRVSGEKANLVIAKLGINNSHRVEAVGFSGGIWIGWKDLS